MFQIKWIYVIILVKCSYLQYISTQINNNEMQRVMKQYVGEQFMFQPFEERRDADVAHGEQELGLRHSKR